jgi:hypothetical protein
VNHQRHYDKLIERARTRPLFAIDPGQSALDKLSRDYLTFPSNTVPLLIAINVTFAAFPRCRHLLIAARL